ncbi:MAG: hypothetical protein Q4G24_03615 [Paracoccus sp. (in: a-proteobacteria)]|uniref:hypothetical protein n=1 Tax=Paracoccus sp. TaxID=267 RepID=UPI0026E05E36|nr:hypothetical protein [Paracoccus sp. (in: a-proteobacteria)]MDO5620538.1 hypothetical protein [Paracoccus sp. (in: a-proteobacteria)]
MTALEQYTRLEASGLWRETPVAQLREVIVSFGNATLILRDPRSEVPLSHWSLPAVRRLNPHETPAIYVPGHDAASEAETLEIDDPLMIEAITRVHRAIDARRPHPGRLRRILAVATLVLMVAGLFWLPAALIGYASRIAPAATRAEMGQAILTDLQRSTGPACTRPSANGALNALATRVFGMPVTVTVLPVALDHALVVPGGQVVIGRDVTQRPDGAGVLIGQLIAAAQNTTQHDPTATALDYAGLRGSLDVLTSGELRPQLFDGYGEALLQSPPPAPDEDALLARFEALNTSSQPYARSLDPSGETVLALIEADPMRGKPPSPAVDPAAWRSISRICNN